MRALALCRVLEPALARLALVLLVVFAPRVAYAFEFRGEQDDLELRVEPEAGERLCVAWPKGNADLEACKGLDLDGVAGAAAAKRAGIETTAVFALRRADSIMIIMVIQGDVLGALDDADEYLTGVANGITKQSGGRLEKKEHETVRVAGRDALRYDFTLAFAPGAPAEKVFGFQRGYHLDARKHGYTVSFTSSRAERAWVERTAERVMRTLEADPPASSRSKRDRDRDDDDDDDDKKASKRKSKLTPFEQGELVGRAIAILGVIALGVWLLVKLTRKKPPAHPPGGWQQQYGPPQYPHHPQQPQYPPQAHPPPFGQAPPSPYAPTQLPAPPQPPAPAARPLPGASYPPPPQPPVPADRPLPGASYPPPPPPMGPGPFNRR